MSQHALHRERPANVGLLVPGQHAAPEPASLPRLQGLKDTVKKLLLAFYRACDKRKPERLIFYRDGVSEGQARPCAPVSAQPVLAPSCACSVHGYYCA